MIGILSNKGNYAIDCLVALKTLPLASVTLKSGVLEGYKFSYGLPEIEKGSIALITSGCVQEVTRRTGSFNSFIAELRVNFGKIVLVDQSDPFALDFTEEEMSLFDSVLKVNGKYLDYDLYNYKVGAASPEGRWTEKIDKQPNNYSASIISKLEVSLPCFFGTIPEVRRAVRVYHDPFFLRRKGKDLVDYSSNLLADNTKLTKTPPETVHFFASLTNIQRKTAVQKLKNSSLPWKGGITSVPPYVAGMGGFGMAKLPEPERLNFIQDMSHLMTNPINRFHYQTSMRDCKAVLSIAGYGELCFRMAEAWQARRVLVCQDISHVETLFPFENGKNVVFCRPDLSDLIEVLDDIECNFDAKYRDIAEQGYKDWKQWGTASKEVIKKGFNSLYN